MQMRLKLVCLVGLLLALNLGANAASKYWIGTGDGTFSDNSRWSTTSGGGNDTTAPAAADLAVFDDGGTGDCTIDASISVQGLNIASGYPGTISQGAAITVGKDGYAQSGGTFLGGAYDMTVQYFTLSAGAFVAPSGTLNIQNTTGGTADRTIFEWTGGTFAHGGGTLKFRSWLAENAYPIHSIILAGKVLNANNLIMTGGSYPSYGRDLTYQLG